MRHGGLTRTHNFEALRRAVMMHRYRTGGRKPSKSARWSGLKKTQMPSESASVRAISMATAHSVFSGSLSFD